MRLNGVSYEEISLAGGGIVSTVKATRAATKNDLLRSARRRLLAMTSEGVTTVEIKSGYGLDLATEQKMLEVANELSKEDVQIIKTFLGAHAVPAEFKGNSNGYIDLVCQEMTPALAGSGLADTVDGFCENIGFSAEQIRRVFDTAKSYGLPFKLHAEQLSDQRGAAPCQLTIWNIYLMKALRRLLNLEPWLFFCRVHFICANGTEMAARKLERVLWNDPATGVMRHADAGYDIAKACAKEHELNLPGIL